MMSDIKKWKRLDRKEVFKHPRMHLAEDRVLLPSDEEAEYLRHMPASSYSVAVLAVNNEQEILLQREYSYPPDEVLWQLPGGGAQKGEEITVAARRELSEESGFDAHDTVILGYFYVDNRRSDHKQYVVLCTNIFKRSLAGDKEEFIESHWISRKDIGAMIKSNEIKNVNLLAALEMYSQHS